jgi:hypothetical protein
MYPSKSTTFSIPSLTNSKMSKIKTTDSSVEEVEYDIVDYNDDNLNLETINTEPISVDVSGVNAVVTTTADVTSEIVIETITEELNEIEETFAQKFNFTISRYHYEVIKDVDELGNVTFNFSATDKKTGQDVSDTINPAFKKFFLKIIGWFGEEFAEVALERWGDDFVIWLIAVFGDDAGEFIAKKLFNNIVTSIARFATDGVGAAVYEGTKTLISDSIKRVGGIITGRAYAKEVAALLEFFEIPSIKGMPVDQVKALYELAKEEAKKNSKLPGLLKTLFYGAENTWKDALKKGITDKLETQTLKWSYRFNKEITEKSIKYLEKTSSALSNTISGAVKSGVFNFIISSGASFVKGAAKGGFKGGLEQLAADAGVNISGAVGATIGEVAGSAIGASIGMFFGGPIGAYVGCQIGKFAGAVVGDVLGRYIYKNWDNIVDGVKEAGAAVVDFASSVVDTAGDALETVGGWISSGWHSIFG